MKNWHVWISAGLIVLFITACSTERNTFLSRSYHSTTAHYNGYFNANDLLNQAISGYRSALKEDYYSVLDLRPLPTEEEVKSMYAPIDTAIAKCTKVIQRHAMPSMDKPSQKREEHNKWIDENWITIGVANYYRRDYTTALKNFEYTKRFFNSDKSAYVAEMWMARVYIEENRLTDAGFAIASLQKAADEVTGDAEGEKKSKKSASKSKKKSKSKAKEKEAAPFPKKLLYEFAVTKALFAEAKKDETNMILALEEALKYAKKSADKARLHFVLGQLLEKNAKRAEASMHYEKVLKYNAPFEMNFNARLKKALNAGGEKVKKELNHLLRDAKNAEFKDQIYFTLAQMEQGEGNEQKAMEYYTKAAFYSTSNARQKGMAYEELGDIYFSKKSYVKAQKYYDSCATVVPEDYPNFIGVKNKARKLEDLVLAIETAQYEDSVQRIAGMDEGERLAFAEKVLKQMKDDEERRKRQEAEKLAALQKAQQSTPAAGGGSKWYWNNERAKQEGFEEFKRQWGQRTNEDNWRRSEKIVFAAFNGEETDSMPVKENAEVPKDSLTAEMLLAKLPTSDSLLKASQERMMEAYYNAGKLYFDQLKEQELAEKQFVTIIEKPFESEYKLLASYQIYRMYPASDPKAQAQKDFILVNYPTSDYAGFIRDPDYFIKKRELLKQTEQEYLTDLQRYERGLYYPVITKANTVITEQKDNPFRPKYYLLKARAQAKINEDKKTLLPTLEELMAQYPGTPEAEAANEMKRIIEGGYSKNEPVEFKKDGIFVYKKDEPMQVIIFLDEKVNVGVAKTRVVDFNKEFFGRERLQTSSKIFGEKTNIVLVKEFPSENEAASYLSTYKRTKKHLMDMQKMKIMYISQDNLKKLFETQKLADYELFFDENY